MTQDAGNNDAPTVRDIATAILRRHGLDGLPAWEVAVMLTYNDRPLREIRNAVGPKTDGQIMRQVQNEVIAAELAGAENQEAVFRKLSERWDNLTPEISDAIAAQIIEETPKEDRDRMKRRLKELRGLSLEVDADAIKGRVKEMRKKAKGEK